ncbi:serine/threonine-protein kinase fused isoform X2 [Halyomorpha halys]|uniref:serine/threonine-protein kinase fused isoform X2 n=1 Tax=Halyomorpha halys TaxID=286706 RepID=UPI0006D4FE85|nr:serine/threonine-protein kinase fused isoform X2 [Halyomorpha halys]
MNNYSLFFPILGEGSFGQVYKARRKSDNEIVALKLIKKHGRTEKELISLRKECEIQRHFNHPNIIQMFDSFETENEIAVVTECAFRDLYRILASERFLHEELARKITSDLVSALYYLHSNRVLHRDLKPQNVLLSEKGVAKLCDFGFARNMSLGTHVLTSIKGTPLYMAPELMEGNPYDHNADLWSLGCITYEMVVGSPPFKTNNILHLANLIRCEPVRWPVSISSDCLSLLKGLLLKNPIERLSWPYLLEHPFVKGHVLITSDQGVTLPLTSELTSSQAHAKELQMQDIIAAQNQIVEEAILEKRRLSTKIMDEPKIKANVSINPSKGDFDDEELIRRLKCMDVQDRSEMQPGEGPNIMCPNQILDEGCQEVCLNALESEEWLVFLQQSMEEIMDGDTESISDAAFVNMVCRALSSSSANVVEYIASLFSIPFTIDSISEAQLEKIRKSYAEVKLVPKLIYATQLITKRCNQNNDLNAEELQALEVIFLLITNLVHTDDVFLEQLCKISVLLSLSKHYAYILSLRRRKLRIATNLLAILSHILRKMPDYRKFVTEVIAAINEPGDELRLMLNQSSDCLVLRTLVLIKELNYRCTDFLILIWNDFIQKDIEHLRYSTVEELRSMAECTLHELTRTNILNEQSFVSQEVFGFCTTR